MSHLKSIKNGQKWLFLKENSHYTENGLLLWLGTSLVYFSENVSFSGLNHSQNIFCDQFFYSFIFYFLFYFIFFVLFFFGLAIIH